MRELIYKKMKEFLDSLSFDYLNFTINSCPDGTFDFRIVLAFEDLSIAIEFTESLFAIDPEDDEIAIWSDGEYVKGEKAKKAFFNQLLIYLIKEINNLECELNIIKGAKNE